MFSFYSTQKYVSQIRVDACNSMHAHVARACHIHSHDKFVSLSVLQADAQFSFTNETFIVVAI